MKINPNNFPTKNTLTGREEVYSQAGGISRRFTLDALMQTVQQQVPLNPIIDYVDYVSEIFIERTYQGDDVYETVLTISELGDFAQGLAPSPTFNMGIKTLLEWSVSYLNTSTGNQRLYFSVNGETGNLIDNKYLTFTINSTGVLSIKDISPQIVDGDAFVLTLKYTKF